MYLILNQDGEKTRGEAYSKVPYESNSETDAVVETTEEDLAKIFEEAKASGGELNGSDASIDSAIEDPLGFLDYLILDSNGAIAFDDAYTRETPDSTSA